MVTPDLDAEVLPFPSAPKQGQDGSERFEHVLDEDPDDPQPVHPAGGFPIPAGAADRYPVVPHWLQSREALAAALVLAQRIGSVTVRTGWGVIPVRREVFA